ncbi:MAG: hypothetical protein ABIO70_12795 [Pseudomonadota bacterium]
MRKALELSLDDITVGADGRVIIQNTEFARALVERIKADPDRVGIFDNCNCGKSVAQMMELVRKVGPGRVGIFDNCNCKGQAMPFEARVLPQAKLSEIAAKRAFTFDSPVAIFDNCDC